MEDGTIVPADITNNITFFLCRMQGGMKRFYRAGSLVVNIYYYSDSKTSNLKIMASIKVKFRASAIEGHEGTIYYQVIQQRKIRQLASGFHIRPEEWDPARSMVVCTPGSPRAGMLLSVREGILRDLERLAKIGHRQTSENIEFSADDLIEAYRRFMSEYSLFTFMERQIGKLKANGKLRTSETYTAALRSFRKFRNEEDIMLDELNSEILEAYEAWHRKRGNSSNTISFYTRILRAAYNRAVEEGAIANLRPFRHVYTGVDKTIKRAVSLRVIKKIKSLDLRHNSPLDFARDMFLMSFYMRGMSFIDMSFLKKSDLKRGHIVYRRRKTGQQLMIEWTSEMQGILSKYPANPTQYLLPIIRRPYINEHYAYRAISYSINHSLKEIARMAGLDLPLTMYVARHSWASAAQAKGIPVSIISEGMGHDREATTRIYLASLDTSLVDKANALILASL